jgi:hypothetical protein
LNSLTVPIRGAVARKPQLKLRVILSRTLSLPPLLFAPAVRRLRLPPALLVVIIAHNSISEFGGGQGGGYFTPQSRETSLSIDFLLPLLFGLLARLSGSFVPAHTGDVVGVVDVP